MNYVYGTTAQTRAQGHQVRAILDLMGENGRRVAKAGTSGTARGRNFRDEVKAKSDTGTQQAASPMPQPAMAQPFAQPSMYPAAGNQQYFATNVPQPQGYYPNMAVQHPMYNQYGRPMGMAPMPQQPTAPSQPINTTQQQPQLHQSQSQPTMPHGYYLTPSTTQAWSSPASNPSHSAQQPRTVSDIPPQTPPSHRQQHPAPGPAGDSPFLQRNIEEMYSADSPQVFGVGHPQQQQQSQQQSGGGPPPPGQMSGTPGSFHPTGAPLGQGQGQWPGTQGLHPTGGPGQ
ncbi:hypothetical protein PG994_003013 [Apiospora phragmitis]|uniref:Uncharacterized protein n=1 Tax=Apiospora phragmitis TaxID=2905665 RepID=A0ABR1W9L9_9PEZI